MATTVSIRNKTTFGGSIRTSDLGAGAQATGNPTLAAVTAAYSSQTANAAAGGADQVYGPVLRTLAGGAAETLDFTGGGLKDLVGGTIALARVKSVIVCLLGADQKAPDGTAGTACTGITLTGSMLVGSGRFITGTTPGVPVVNGGKFEISYGNAAGLTVSGGSTDELTITNNDGAVSAKYMIQVVGGTT